MEREYTVIANTREDLPALEAEITASSGAGPVPNRSVDVANPRLGSKIQTHFMLTDEEAEALRADPRVRAVEIPPEQRDDIEIGVRGRQYSNFNKGAGDNTTVNWGLRRCVETTNVYQQLPFSPDDKYIYALDGTGVDVVIQDSGIDTGHPEWEDRNGVSRLQQIDWYTASGIAGTQDANHYRDRDGHGTHCAGIAAGKTYGWAKGAHIYSQKVAGLETLQGSDGTGISVSDVFDTIRLWHNAKTNGRPTVVNMSWGYSSSQTGNPTGGTYRGTPWTYTSQSNTQLWSSFGVVPPLGISRRFPASIASVDAEVDDMISDGIHICLAAGNDYYKADVPLGADYDNFITFSGSNRFYHRPGSPYSSGAFFVGNIGTTPILSNGNQLDATSASSKRGPAVNIWAPGTSIMSTTSRLRDTQYDGSAYTYPGDPNYEIMAIGGTSMASPQVAGVIALHLQQYPLTTPQEMQTKIFNDSFQTVYTTANNDSDYNTSSILGSPNRMLFSRYNIDPVSVQGNTSILEFITIQP